MKIRNLISCALCGLTLFACSPSGGGKDREMDRFITDLMDRMTLREKLGQLNLPSGGDLVTGSVMNGELSDMIRKQEIGGFFNVKGIQKINVPCGTEGRNDTYERRYGMGASPLLHLSLSGRNTDQ